MSYGGERSGGKDFFCCQQSLKIHKIICKSNSSIAFSKLTKELIY